MVKKTTLFFIIFAVLSLPVVLSFKKTQAVPVQVSFPSAARNLASMTERDNSNCVMKKSWRWICASKDRAKEHCKKDQIQEYRVCKSSQL